MRNWERLATELKAVRESDGLHNREEFARSRGLANSRTVLELERGVRDNYRPSTLRDAERWYRLTRGNIDEILAGGKVRRSDTPSDTDVRDPLDAVLLDLPESALQGLSEVERQEVRAAAIDAALRRAREIRQQ